MFSKNPELTRLYIHLLLVFIIFVAVALGIAHVHTESIQQIMLFHQAAITGLVVESYPDLEPAVVRELLQPTAETTAHGQDILRKYGITASEQFMNVEYMADIKQQQRFFMIMLVFLSFAACSIWFLLFFKKHYARLHQATEYAKSVASGNNDSLDIRDNAEGELSILKNEIYKITTMLKEQANMLQKDKSALADSIADISHQLKTPLTSLLMLNDLLQDMPSEATREQFLVRVRAQLKRMEWLVSSLLKLSKLDAGTVVFKKERFTAEKLLNNALESLKIPIEIKQIELRIAGAVSAEIVGDFNWTSEALINMLKNGIEHTPEQGWIEITVEDNLIYTKLYIQDDGAGIDKSDIPFLFNRFYRGKNATDDSVGIGLAMAHAIVKKQGGDIHVHSEKGNGTQFELTFFKPIHPTK